MSKLRIRFIEDLQLAGMSTATQKAYVREVAKLSKFFSKSPSEITDDELRSYFLLASREKKWARAHIRWPFAVSNSSGKNSETQLVTYWNSAAPAGKEASCSSFPA